LNTLKFSVIELNLLFWNEPYLILGSLYYER